MMFCVRMVPPPPYLLGRCQHNHPINDFQFNLDEHGKMKLRKLVDVFVGMVPPLTKKGEEWNIHSGFRQKQGEYNAQLKTGE